MKLLEFYSVMIDCDPLMLCPIPSMLKKDNWFSLLKSKISFTAEHNRYEMKTSNTSASVVHKKGKQLNTIQLKPQ